MIKQYLQQYKKLMPSANPRIEEYSKNDVLVQSVKRTTNLVKGRERLEADIYKQKGQNPPQEPWEDDISVAQKTPQEPKPETEEKAEPQTPEEQPVPQTPAAPGTGAMPPTGGPMQYTEQDVSLKLKDMLKSVFYQLKGVDLNNLSTAPPAVVLKAKRMFDNAIFYIKNDPTMGPHLDEALRSINLDKLQNYVPPLSGPTANTVNKLIKLANKLDEEGRGSEAEVVDKVIEATIKKAVQCLK
jgi:hypothetical protein